MKGRQYQITRKWDPPDESMPSLSMSLRTEWNHTADAWEAMSDDGSRIHLGRPEDSQHDVALLGFAQMFGTTTRSGALAGEAGKLDLEARLADLRLGWRVRLYNDGALFPESRERDEWVLELIGDRSSHRFRGSLSSVIARAWAGEKGDE